ncbi:MAG: hypothetical protein Q9227_006150 [Pyrenula ochraceoflavens]
MVSTDLEFPWPRDWRAYRALLGGFLLMFNSWGLVNAFGSFQSFYRTHLLTSVDTKLITLLGATQCFFTLVVSFAMGRLLDAGLHRYLAAAGGLVTTFGMFMLSLTAGDGGFDQGKYIYVWLAQGLCVGLGMACVFVYSSQVVACWFPKRRSLAIGISASGASIAGLVYPLTLKFLLTSHPFPTSIRLLSIITATTSLISFFAAIPNPAIKPRKPPSWTTLSVWLDPSALRCRAYVLFTSSVCLIFLGFYPLFFNLEDWAQDRGIGLREDIQPGTGVRPPHKGTIRTFWLLAIMNACSFIGRISAAALGDRFGAILIHACATSLAAILALVFWQLANSLAAALPFCICFGIVSGAVIALPPACVASLLPRSELHRLGQWTGMMYTVVAPFAMAGPVIGGALAEEVGYRALQVWCGACFAAAAGCMGAAWWVGRDGKDGEGMVVVREKRSQESSGTSTPSVAAV